MRICGIDEQTNKGCLSVTRGAIWILESEGLLTGPNTCDTALGKSSLGLSFPIYVLGNGTHTLGLF